MAHYWVVSPEISIVIPIMDDGSGPVEHECCMVSVVADNTRQARAIAIKMREMRDWVDMQRSDNKNPFSGLRVVDALCSHGVCNCDICQGYCEKCYEDAAKESE